MKNNTVGFYLPKNYINDATQYYIDIIEEAFSTLGSDIKKANNISSLNGCSIILAIDAKTALIAKLRFPRSRIITWYQGVVAEEVRLTNRPYFKKVAWHILEYFSLRLSLINIFVSCAMKEYFIDRYKFSNDNFYIMPCFNKALINKVEINSDKFEKPTFVYAGSFAKWQCTDEMIEVFSLVEKEIQNAHLTILTGDKENAIKTLKKYKVKNYTVDYIALSEIDAVIKQYKYGFLIRENDIVNRVATPTKMNSYLSMQVIPIYTDVITDFNQHIDLGDFSILLDHKKSIEEWGKAIIDFEKCNHVDVENFYSKCEEVFTDYYSREKYFNGLVEIFRNLKK